MVITLEKRTADSVKIYFEKTNRPEIKQVLPQKAKTVEEAKQNPLLSTLINEGIEQYNKVAVSRAQNVRKWILLDRDLSLATGELTATLKLRRGVVQLNFKEKINQLYE